MYIRFLHLATCANQSGFGYYLTQMQYEGSEELTTVKHIKNNILTWRQHVNQTEQRKASLDWRLISQGCCNRNSHRLNTNLEDHALKPSGTSRVPTFQHRAIRNDPSDVSNLWGACTNHLPPRHRFAPWRWSWPTFRRSSIHWACFGNVSLLVKF